MKRKLFPVIIFFAMLNLIKAQDTLYSELDWFVFDQTKYKIFYTAKDSLDIAEYINYFNPGVDTVEKYFGETFRDLFGVVIHPDRASLDAQWSHDWGMPGFKSECWMVGSGVADKFDFLSPKVWKKEACEHDPNDIAEIKKFIAHELVHVYHGQINENHYFDGMDDFAWFIEGIAVHVSGQLDEDRINGLKEAVRNNQLPKYLKFAWDGKYRYGICGSMAAYIEKKYGGKTLIDLLKVQSTSEALDLLRSNELKFITEWKSFVEKM